MQSLLLEQMTWPEIKEAMDNGVDTVLIFAASIEQHGPGLPEITDTVLGYTEAVDLAERLGNALVAPVIRPGLSRHHMDFPGSITLRPEVFRGIVEDYISAYVHHGFKKIVLSSSHGGNYNELERVAAEMSEKYRDVCIVPGCSLDDLDAHLVETEKAEGMMPGVCGGHACDWEASLMAMLDEGYLRRDKLESGYIGSFTPEISERFFNEGVKSISVNGVMGDPTQADAERGKRYFERFQNMQEQAIRANIKAWEEAHK